MSVINSIKAIILLHIDGRKIVAKYYDDQLQSTSKQFERRLFAKTKNLKQKDEVLILDGFLILHRYKDPDTHIYVIGGKNENPLVLDSVLSCIVDVVSMIQDQHPGEGSRIFSNLDKIILALDEIADSGMILEIDPNLVHQRITSNQHEDFESLAHKGIRKLMGF